MMNAISRVCLSLSLFGLLLAVASLTYALPKPDSHHVLPDISQIDLRQQRWNHGEHFDLTGTWDFAWQQILLPRHSGHANWQYAEIPGAWNQHDDSISGMGYATYRIRILVPDDITQFHLYMPDMASAYQLWANNHFVTGNGVVGTQKEEETPEYGPKVIPLSAINGTLDLVLISSNYHYQWGGLWYPPKITDDSGVFSLRELPHIRASIFSTLLIGTGLLSLLMFLSRREDRKVLFFSLLCFAIGLRRLLIDERIFYTLDVFDWHTLQFLENVTVYLSMPLLLGYLRYLFPNEFSPKLAAFGWVLALPFILAAATLDVADYTRFNVLFQIIAVALIPLVFVFYFKALHAKRKGAKMFGLSLSIFSLAVINDALNYNYIVDTPNMIHIGTLAFVLFQLASLINRYLKNFKTIESMSTRLQEQNKELQQLDAYKDEFLAATSHELRTPLHSISGLSRLIKQESPRLSSSQQQKLDIIEATSQRLNNLVNDILDASSIKHGKLKLNAAQVHIKALIDGVVQSMRPLLLGKRVQLRVESTPETANLHIKADAQRLQQVLINLLSNAIKFTETGQILIDSKLNEDSNNLVISVRDTGLGIPVDEQQRLFQPFENYLQVTSKTLESTGLGLSICKKLVELHGGKLTLESIEGEGTTVEIRLPLQPEFQSNTVNSVSMPNECAADIRASTNLEIATTTSGQASHNASSSLNTENGETRIRAENGNRSLIYYADDEAINRELLQSELSTAQFEVLTFTGAKELILALSRRLPDLIILDLMMPGMNGIEACRDIRKHYHSAQLPIVMLTARHQTSDIVASLRAGANDYLTKPYHSQELDARLNAQLSVSELWRSREENQKLKHDLDEKTQLQKALEQANQELQSAADLSQDALLIIDQDLDIQHCNKAGSALLGQPLSALLGENLTDFFDPLALTQIRATLELGEPDLSITIKINDIETIARIIRSKKGASESETYILALKQQESQSALQTDILTRLARDLDESQQRILQIEQALANQVGSEVEETDHSEPAESVKQETVSAEELIVKTMRFALSAWERHTHQSKVDLAEQSRCWSVYLDGTSAKTRTLDKYLSLKTLPGKPRWRSVINTAKFVIDRGNLPSDESGQLETFCEQIDQAFS